MVARYVLINYAQRTRGNIPELQARPDTGVCSSPSTRKTHLALDRIVFHRGSKVLVHNYMYLPGSQNSLLNKNQNFTYLDGLGIMVEFFFYIPQMGIGTWQTKQLDATYVGCQVSV